MPQDYVSIYANICAPVIWFKSVKTGILEFVSPAITKLLGYSPQDFYQTPFLGVKDLFSGPKLARLSGLISNLSSEDACARCLLQGLRCGWTHTFFRREIHEYRDSEDNLLGFIGHKIQHLYSKDRMIYSLISRFTRIYWLQKPSTSTLMSATLTLLSYHHLSRP